MNEVIYIVIKDVDMNIKPVTKLYKHIKCKQGNGLDIKLINPSHYEYVKDKIHIQLIAEDLEDAKIKLKDYIDNISKNIYYIYNQYTDKINKIEVIGNNLPEGYYANQDIEKVKLYRFEKLQELKLKYQSIHDELILELDDVKEKINIIANRLNRVDEEIL